VRVQSHPPPEARMTRKLYATIARTSVVAALSVAASGCESPQPLAPTASIAEFIPRVSLTDGTAATLRQGAAPLASAAAAPTVPASATAVNGGSAQVPVTGAAEYSAIYISLAGADDYWELQLPAGASASDVIVGVASSLSASTLRLLYAVSSAGAVSQYASQTLQVYRVGTGDVQVSVSWTGASDVDLHVYDPNGEQVYFGNPASASGGALDLDSNAACNIDNVNNENIVWPVGGAPRGEYRVVVDYWADCGVSRSDYVVTVQVQGTAPRVFTGSFAGAADANPDAEVVTFSF